MRKLRTFAHVFIQSMISPAYYAEIYKTKLSFSIKYAVVLAFFLAVIGMLKLVLPLSLFPLQTSLQNVVQEFPSKLLIQVNQGKVSINQAYPYAIPMPAAWKTAQAPANLVIFDSDQHLASVSATEINQALFVVGQTVVVAPPDPSTNQENIMPLPAKLQLPMISQSQLNDWLQQLMQKPLLKYKLYVPLLGFLDLIVTWPLVFVFRILTVLFYAIDAYVIAKIFKSGILHKQSVKFGKIFQMSIHTITLPTVLAVLTSAIIPDFLFQGLVYFAIYMGYTLFVLQKLTQKAVS